MSIMARIPNSITMRVGRTILQTQKHSPTILFAVGAVGVIATAVTASRATLQLSDILEESKTDLDTAKKLLVSETKKYSEQTYRKDVAVIYALGARKVVRLYAPSIMIGTASIAALTGSYSILMRRNLALTAAYSALDRGFKRYRENVVRTYGADADRRLRHDHEFHKITDYDTETDENRSRVVARAKKTPNDYSIYARFFDQTVPSWSPIPEYNRIFLQAKQVHANNLLKSRGHIFLNEIYDSMGLERSRAGAVVGWVLGNGDDFVDFGLFYGERDKIRDFMNMHEGAVLLDFNVDGVIYDKI